MIACLPMYDRPETAAAHDALWAALRDDLHDRGIDAPACLTRGGDLWAGWESGDLLLGQTCSLPFRTRLHPRVTLVANPDFGLPDSPPGHYHSVVVTRKGAPRNLDHYRNRRFALNDVLSQSGWAAPQDLARAHGFTFEHTLETGAHRASAAAIAEGRADIAAVDAQTWRAIQTHVASVSDRLQVIARTAASPAPPYITAFAELAPVLARALTNAINALPAPHRATLGLAGVVRLPLTAHLDLPIPPAAATNGAKTRSSPTSGENSTLQSAG